MQAFSAGYAPSMTKHVIDIDDGLLQRAREIMGTGNTGETVNRALADVVESGTRRRHVLRLSSMEGLDLNDESVMSSAWE